MADEMKKLENELKRFSNRMEKEAGKWLNYVDTESDKVVRFIKDNTKDLSDTIAKERRKIELRSEIGERSRALAKAYARLGEAYYESLQNRRSMDDIKDVVALIDSNRKVVDLLNDQLSGLEGKPAK